MTAKMAVKQNGIKLMSLVAIILLHVQETLSARNAVTHVFKVNIPEADPQVAKILGKKCDAKEFEKQNISAWWHTYLYDTFEDVKPLPILTTATKAQLDDLCFTDKDNYAYLYQCNLKTEKCECMSEPVQTNGVLLKSGSDVITCLVAHNQKCVTLNRVALDLNANDKKYIQYPCYPGYYCDSRITKKCQDCANEKVHPLCPDPKSSAISSKKIVGLFWIATIFTLRILCLYGF